MVMNEDDRQSVNWAKLEHLKEILMRLPPKVLQRGFYGNVWVEVKIQDGVIQDMVARLEESMK